ncbi:GntR family transcriptional regulator [Evansella cellulosilytica]|uniref:Transcriptional regulator, GntR family n=1 Tax=Evansella cellulosilytica (strain ATCC 21833 / DSM 2522 / FERM P-1141 / JCM 9156 / N-4) TaxID=649639 RepID=E6TQK5_EVAC2|nr:GntR family transcriptional regulator [Evansella cellulosilytica]ADU30516.1 transcriptional regulator, GntR family [Evansella cellulosilytica DSM 2522]
MSNNLPIHINETSRIPIYDQIESQLKTLIISGSLPSGTALPSIRKLASSLSCSVITTRRAYQNLEHAGYIKTIQGKGTFVSLINSDEQHTQKQLAVTNAIKEVISIGKSYQYSKKELLSLFHKLLEEELDD